MSPFAKSLRPTARALEARFNQLTESSLEALQRFESECGWSDAPALLGELLPRVPETPAAEPGAA